MDTGADGRRDAGGARLGGRPAFGGGVLGGGGGAIEGRRLWELLGTLPDGGGGGGEAARGQLFAVIAEPVGALWSAFAEGRRDSGAVVDDELTRFLARVPPNPLVSELSACGGGGGIDGDGEAALERAKLLVQERVLIGTVSQPERALEAMGAAFGWARLRASPADDAALAALLRAANASAAAAPPPELAARLRRHVALDVRLYEFGARLAREQHRSLVWAPEEAAADGGDGASAAADGEPPVCAAADRGARARSQHQFERPVPMELGKTLAFAFDGDAYKVYELRLPPPPRGLQLYARGRNLIGESTIAFNVFISHRGAQPTFSDHAFRYDHKTTAGAHRPAKFTLTAARLRKCCEEAAAREADEAAAEEGGDALRDDDFNATAACATRDATLWIAFKARAVAASELSFYAKQVTRKRKEGDRQG